LKLSREPLTVAGMQYTTARGPPCRDSLIVSLRRAGCQVGERRYPGLAQGQEGAAAIVLPNGFHDLWFHEQVAEMSHTEAFEAQVQQLKEIVPMANEMDSRQRDMLVMALGAGLP